MKHRPLKPHTSFSSASPLLALALATGVFYVFGHLKPTPPKKSPELSNAGFMADTKMRVVYRCRVGDSYDRVKSYLAGASKIETYCSGPKQVKLTVTWPSQGRTFNGRFDDNRLVWATEQVSLPDTHVVKTCFINTSDPLVPMSMTTMLHRTNSGTELAFDDPRATADTTD